MSSSAEGSTKHEWQTEIESYRTFNGENAFGGTTQKPAKEEESK